MRSIASMVDQLGDDFDFWILTNDRDLNDEQPYPNIQQDQWARLGNAHIYYTNIKTLSFRDLNKLISGLNPSIIYLNIFFSSLSNKYLLARRLGMIPQIPTLIAPRGVFSPGALRLKRSKKRLFLLVVGWGGFLKGLQWQASTEFEKKDILSALPRINESAVYIAPNMATTIFRNDDHEIVNNSLKKEPGFGRFIFLSRVSPKKNLKYALTLLADVQGQIRFDIVGPFEDRAYWAECQHLIANLPAHVSVHAHGPIDHEMVGKTLAGSHFFLFPTLGENFGHVIVEALQSGCLPLISDQTPWNDLPDYNAGWVIPLNDRNKWSETVQFCIDMQQDVYQIHSANAKQYAQRWLSPSAAPQANKDMFMSIVRS